MEKYLTSAAHLLISSLAFMWNGFAFLAAVSIIAAIAVIALKNRLESKKQRLCPLHDHPLTKQACHSCRAIGDGCSHCDGRGEIDVCDICEEGKYG